MVGAVSEGVPQGTNERRTMTTTTRSGREPGRRVRPGLAVAIALSVSAAAWTAVAGAGLVVVRHDHLIADRLATLAGTGADLFLRGAMSFGDRHLPPRIERGPDVSALG